ncbi:hypothetical protein BgAZ_400940 [Babesia gibsoni]|uniref:Bromo domain-containing protein n=1 Tax=Babesia gibsoni TaxID=33632 RepID=A0AAD8LH27_BABGI|nr:hypothetical protein BgAZ_400940 [Babesia gibsoni]
MGGPELLPSMDDAVLPAHRGEVTLSPEEADKFNSLTSQSGFRFDVFASETAFIKRPKKPKSDLFLTKEDDSSNSIDYKRRASYSSMLSTFSHADDSLAYSSVETSEKRSLRKRKQRITYYEEFGDDAVENNYRDIKNEKPHKSQKESIRKQYSSSYEKKTPLPLYREVPMLNRNLPKLPRDTWEYTAYRLLQSIKYMDGDKWFWYPVDPIADGVPTYRKVIQTPMDFHTITERLHLRQYSNPFGWQCDMRQIFFNAFLFYPPENLIWQAADHLARLFQDKLRNTPYLQPNEFQILLSKGEDAMRNALLEFNETTFNRKGKWASNSMNGLDENGILHPLEKRKAAQNHKHKHVMDDFMYNDDDDDSFNELSSAASGDEYMMPIEHTRGRPRGSKKKGLQTKMSVSRKHRSGNSSDGSDSGSRNRFTGEFIIPDIGEVPPPPQLQKVGIMERSLTPSQTRTLEINLSRLAPNQRKAALELVQDDLGILAEAFMHDRSFTFDPTLLSVDKQRRIFIYINQMVKRNIEAMQAAYARMRKSKQGKENQKLEHKESGISNPSEIFDASSSSSSSLSDVVSNFLSSDEFFDSSDDEGNGGESEMKKESKPETPLPEYKPVDELRSEKAQLTRGIMGDHADFLTHVESPASAEDPSQVQQGKKSAWMEWKGQAIHHGTVAQQNGVKPRSVDEKIAESFDARI